MSEHPKAFICHSSEDNLVAEKLASDLLAQGVDAWFDKWEIKPGDSLRRKIDEGIERAGYFIVLLSQDALKREWVLTELDAGMIKRIEGSCRLIVCPLMIAHEEIPVTLRGRRYVSLDDYESGLRELVNVCHGLSEKPALGPLPRMPIQIYGLSPIASKVAAYINELSVNGVALDPILYLADIAEALSLPYEEAEDAITELEHSLLIEQMKYCNASPEISARVDLFWYTDFAVKGWDTIEDAVTMATALQNDPEQALTVEQLAAKLEWSPRRANPAAAYLVEHHHVMGSECCGTQPYAYLWLYKTSETRLFVKQNAR